MSEWTICFRFDGKSGLNDKWLLSISTQEGKSSYLNSYLERFRTLYKTTLRHKGRMPYEFSTVTSQQDYSALALFFFCLLVLHATPDSRGLAN